MGPLFICLYHFHRLTNIQAFICIFACLMTTINCISFVTTRLLLDDIYHPVESPFDCLLVFSIFIKVWWRMYDDDGMILHLRFSKRQWLHKKWSFPLRISWVNVTKSVVSCGFGHIYRRNLWWKTYFLCSE